METTLKDRKPVEATVEVTASAAEVDAAYDRILSSYARQVRIPGFRPGKAPRGVLIKRIGEEELGQEVREALIDGIYETAVREHELTPLHGHAHGGTPTQGESFVFDLHMDLYPDFQLPDVREIVLDTEAAPVGDDAVNETVENLRREHATLVPVDRAAEPGDQVLIETLGENDEPSEEGSAMPVDLEAVGEALAEQLIGHGIDDVVELTLDDVAQRDEEGAAATTTMRVRIADVKEKEKSEPDDEFATTLGFDDWNSVLTAIRDSLENQARERVDEERREEFVDKLMEHTDVELPGILVNRRQRQLLENLQEDLKGQGTDMQTYIANLEKDGKREEFEAELNESSARGVKRDLVLERLLEERPVEVSDEEFEDALNFIASREGKDPAAFRRDRGEEWLRNYRFLLMRDKALRATVAELSGNDADAGGAGDSGAGSEAEPEREAHAAEVAASADVATAAAETTGDNAPSGGDTGGAEGAGDEDSTAGDAAEGEVDRSA